MGLSRFAAGLARLRAALAAPLGPVPGRGAGEAVLELAPLRGCPRQW